jgi:hypothetical protein
MPYPLKSLMVIKTNKKSPKEKLRRGYKTVNLLLNVRPKGLEPPRLSALDPKSSAATNYATAAKTILQINELTSI